MQFARPNRSAVSLSLFLSICKSNIIAIVITIASCQQNFLLSKSHSIRDWMASVFTIWIDKINRLMGPVKAAGRKTWQCCIMFLGTSWKVYKSTFLHPFIKHFHSLSTFFRHLHVKTCNCCDVTTINNWINEWTLIQQMEHLQCSKRSD